jgi:hypothetical protein
MAKAAFEKKQTLFTSKLVLNLRSYAEICILTNTFSIPDLYLLVFLFVFGKKVIRIRFISF